MRMNRAWQAVVALAVVVAAILVTTRRGIDRDGPLPPPAKVTGVAPTVAPPLAASPDRAVGRDGTVAPETQAAAPVDEIEVLAGALGAADPAAARAAARDLRLRLRTDPEARARAVQRLLDPGTSADLRMALALVLGTLPASSGDAALLEALAAFPRDVAFLRCALLALGAQRDPEDDDDVFGLGDRPYGAMGPGGLGITVRRVVPLGAVSEALTAHLRRTEPELRWAAARALGESLAASPVRSAFLSVLEVESTDDVAAALGRALSAWAGRGGDAKERGAVTSALVARAAEPAFDAYRFALEDAFQRVPASPRDRFDLAALSTPDRPFGVRVFAVTALGWLASRDADAVPDVRAALLERLRDGDPAVRDLSARWLGRLPYDREAARILAVAAREDPAWNVRFTALESFARIAPREEGLALARAARADPDGRVSARAEGLVRTLEKPR